MRMKSELHFTSYNAQKASHANISFCVVCVCARTRANMYVEGYEDQTEGPRPKDKREKYRCTLWWDWVCICQSSFFCGAHLLEEQGFRGEIGPAPSLSSYSS